jgi:hypothetical protein
MNVDQHLDEIALRQFTWKNKKLLTSCLLIAKKASEKNDVFWPDEVTFDFLLTDDDRNVIGSAWRMVTKMGLVEKTGNWRRSTFQASAGRTIFEYRCINNALARAFVKRYDVDSYRAMCTPQLNLGL